MNVFFLLQNERLPSSRVRVLNLLPELRRHGIVCECQSYPRSLVAKWRLLLRAAPAHDAVFLQKKMPSTIEFALLRRSARKLVFDLGINADIVDHGKSGFVAKSAEELHDGLLQLAQDRALRREFGRQARQKVEAFYSVVSVGKLLAKELTNLSNS